LSKLLLNRKFFTFPLARSNFQASVFWLAILTLILFIYRSNFSCISVFCWLLIPTFTLFSVRVGEFQFSHFQFSRFRCPSFNFSRFRWHVPIFTLLLCQFPAETNAYFQIGIICVISAQVSCNVPPLGEVGD
jgi:hypothetical protein